ncbi:MAG: MASE1 domain-containing protein [Acidimicrobiales bacterium]
MPNSKPLGAAIVAGVAFYALAYLAQFWSGDLKPSPLWLATASTPALALLAPRTWRWFIVAGGVIGDILASLILVDETLRSMLGPVAGNTAEAIVVIVLVERLLTKTRSVRRTRESLLILAVVVLASSVGGLIAIISTESVIIGERFESWWRWTLGDSVGELHLVSLALSLRAPNLLPEHRFKEAEIVASLVTLVALGVASFALDSPLTYLVVPTVLWFAIRFGPRMAAPVAFLTAILTTTASGQGLGPFVDFGSDAVFQVQAFNIAVGMSALVGGAHSVRAWNDQQRLRAVISSLPDIAVIANTDGEIVNRWAPSGQDRWAAELAGAIGGSLPSPIDGQPDPVEVTVVSTNDGEVFERRVARVDDERELVLFRDVTVERKALRELGLKREAVEDLRLAEQLRLGRTLHDSPVQLLSAALLQLEAESRSGDESVRVEKAKQQVGQAVAELRQLLSDLIPPAVEDGLVAASLQHVARQLLDPGVVVEVNKHDDVDDVQAARTLFQVGREAVANAALHAQPTRVEIAVARSYDGFALRILDDGVGLVSENGRSGVGVELMRERVESMDGTFTIENRDTGGVEVTAKIKCLYH